MAIEKVLLYGLALILILAPLPFGAVQPWAAATLTATCLALGGGWIVWRCRRGLACLPWKDPVLLGGLLFLLVGIAQVTPVPRGVLETVSPRAVDLRDQYEPVQEDAKAIKWRPISLDPWATRSATLRFAACLFVALMATDLSRRRSGDRVLAGALVISGGFQAIYGMAEYFSGHQQIFGYVKKYYARVATGTFINRNHYAGYLEMTLPIVIALAAMAISRFAKRHPTDGRDSPEDARGRAFFRLSVLLVLALFMATALVSSHSRMGIVSILAALLCVGALMALRGRGRSFLTAAIAVILITGVLFSQGEAGRPIVDRFFGTDLDFQGATGRVTIWRQASDLAGDFPLVGVGLGAFKEVFPLYRDTGAGRAITHAHNDYLELATEAGVIGCLVALVGTILAILSLQGSRRMPPWRRPENPLGYAALAAVLAIAFHSLTDFNLAIPANAVTIGAVAGLALALLRQPETLLLQEKIAQGRVPPRAMIAAAAMGLAAFVAIGPLIAEARVQEDQASVPGGILVTASVAGDNPDGLFLAADATARAAMRDLRTFGEAQATGIAPSTTAVSYIQRRLERAINLQESGLRMRPMSSGGHLALGRYRMARCAATALAATEVGDCAAGAVRQLRKALELSPMSARRHAQVADYLIKSWPILEEKERKESRAIIERALWMDPTMVELAEEWEAIRNAAALVPIEKKQ